jgi:hypothetical protein
MADIRSRVRIEIHGDRESGRGSSGYLLDNAIAPVLSAERRPDHPRDESHGPKYPTIYVDLVPSTPVPEVSYTCAAREDARGELEHERTIAGERTLRKRVSGGRF